MDKEKSQFEINFEKNMIEMFKDSCKFILEDDIDENSFQCASDTIYHTLTYLSRRRHKQHYEMEASDKNS